MDKVEVQPAYEIGRVGTRVLLDKIGRRRDQVEDLVLPTQTVIRASCGCAPMLNTSLATLIAA